MYIGLKCFLLVLAVKMLSLILEGLHLCQFCSVGSPRESGARSQDHSPRNTRAGAERGRCSLRVFCVPDK